MDRAQTCYMGRTYSTKKATFLSRATKVALSVYIGPKPHFPFSGSLTGRAHQAPSPSRSRALGFFLNPPPPSRLRLQTSKRGGDHHHSPPPASTPTSAPVAAAAAAAACRRRRGDVLRHPLFGSDPEGAPFRRRRRRRSRDSLFLLF